MGIKEARMADDIDAPTIGGLEIRKLVREYVQVKGGGEYTFGQTLDISLEEAARNGQEVQAIKIEIDPKHWHEWAKKFRA